MSSSPLSHSFLYMLTNSAAKHSLLFLLYIFNRTVFPCMYCLDVYLNYNKNTKKNKTSLPTSLNIQFQPHAGNKPWQSKRQHEISLDGSSGTPSHCRLLFSPQVDHLPWKNRLVCTGQGAAPSEKMICADMLRTAFHHTASQQILCIPSFWCYSTDSFEHFNEQLRIHHGRSWSTVAMRIAEWVK